MSYEKEYHEKVHNYLYKDEEYYWARARLSFKRYFSRIRNIQNLKVLEFGAGLGQNIILLKNKVAFDMSKFALDYCKKRGIPTISNEKKIPNDFDIIFSCHCLEHLDLPLENLKFLRTKLKTNGVLILVIPKLPHRKAPFGPDKHYELHSWNFRTINNLLHRAGYKVVLNRYLYGTMYHKLLFLNKISFRLYNFATWFVGWLLNAGEIKVVAVKN
jgi:SAM-dependent methyltransferase